MTSAPTSATATDDAINSRPPFWVPLILLITASLAVRVGDFDHFFQRKFWSANGGWHLEDNGWVQFLYQYGSWPALIFAGSSLVVCISSLFAPGLKPKRFFCGFIVIALIVGPGFLVNTVFKGFYGRPRPRQVIEFGGSQVFRPLGEPTFDSRSKSFPSGHASMGFFWFAPSVFLWQRHRRIAISFAVVALFHGGIMSIGRMAQGGHWFSDNLWAAGVVYLSSWAIYCIACSSPFKQNTRFPHTNSPSRNETVSIDYREKTGTGAG